jgi:hypothetical protein
MWILSRQSCEGAARARDDANLNPLGKPPTSDDANPGRRATDD